MRERHFGNNQQQNVIAAFHKKARQSGMGSVSVKCGGRRSKKSWNCCMVMFLIDKTNRI